MPGPVPSCDKAPLGDRALGSGGVWSRRQRTRRLRL